MFRAARAVIKYSSVSDASKMPYCSDGPTKQFVWPYLLIQLNIGYYSIIALTLFLAVKWPLPCTQSFRRLPEEARQEC